MDLIRDSVPKFKRGDGRIGAKGYMHYDGNDGGGTIEWDFLEDQRGIDVFVWQEVVKEVVAYTSSNTNRPWTVSLCTPRASSDLFFVHSIAVT